MTKKESNNNNDDEGKKSDKFWSHLEWKKDKAKKLQVEFIIIIFRVIYKIARTLKPFCTQN